MNGEARGPQDKKLGSSTQCLTVNTPHSRHDPHPSPTFRSSSFQGLPDPGALPATAEETTHVQVLSPPSFLGWQAILRPLQKKHARNGSFLGSFFPRLPRRGGEEPSSSSSSSSSESPPPFPPIPPPPLRPSRCPRGSVSGYVINVRVCR
jgi:hypothetical protein